jgi:serine beta-lactamase-like protein LACTB
MPRVQHWLPVVSLILFTFAGAEPVVSVQAQKAPVDAKVEVRRFAEELRTRLNLPAVAVAVSNNGTIAASEAIGLADLDGKTPVTTTSLFRIGSLSKLLTATSALRLHQAGALDLDAPISRYLKGLPEDKASITARQILGHLSGFRHYGVDDYISTQKFANVTDSLPRLLAIPLLSAPGAKYAYSSYGFNLLGAVIQAAAGKEFREVVADRVTRPLRMTHTIAEVLPAPASRTQLYGRGAQNELALSPASDVSDRWPSGGFLSTAEDLVRLGTGILQPGFLHADLREMAFSSQHGEDGKDTNVGLAWRIAKDDQGRRYVHHGGDSIGGRAFILVYPDLKLAVAITTNVSSAAFNQNDALALAKGFLGK